MSIIPCLTWVKRGKAKTNPDRVLLDKEELKRIIDETTEEIENEEEDGLEEENDSDSECMDEAAVGATGGRAKVKKGKRTADMADVDDAEGFYERYHMDDYDDEDESNPLKGIGNLTIYASNEEDPYITLKDDNESDEEEDYQIKPTDNLILVGRVEEDMCILEVHVYNAELANLYVHHDILLPSFPLAMEWLDYDISDDKPGSFVAVGSMEPTIDIWDLDLVDNLEPVATLGTRHKKKGKKKSGSPGHKDAVLDLSWNANVRHALASASADFTVALWDLSEGKMVTSVTQHKEKVQCVKWHPLEAQSLLSGSFDHTVKVYDCRNPNTTFKSWTIDGEVERVRWNQFSPMQFYASTDKGFVYCFDSRQDKPLFSLSAHNDSVTGVTLSCDDPNILVTSSTDHQFKVWDVKGNKPSLVHSQNLKLGKLHCVESCPEAPYVFAIGGDKNLKVWDIRENSKVLSHLSGQSAENPTEPADEQTDKMEDVSVDTQDSGVAMETEAAAATTEQTTKKKKKRKKKKKQNIL